MFSWSFLLFFSSIHVPCCFLAFLLSVLMSKMHVYFLPIQAQNKKIGLVCRQETYFFFHFFWSALPSSGLTKNECNKTPKKKNKQELRCVDVSIKVPPFLLFVHLFVRVCMHDHHTHTLNITNPTGAVFFFFFYTLTRALDLFAWMNVCYFNLHFLHAYFSILTFYNLPLPLFGNCCTVSPCEWTSKKCPTLQEKNKVHSPAASLSPFSYLAAVLWTPLQHPISIHSKRMMMMMRSAPVSLSLSLSALSDLVYLYSHLQLPYYDPRFLNASNTSTRLGSTSFVARYSKTPEVGSIGVLVHTHPHGLCLEEPRGKGGPLFSCFSSASILRCGPHDRARFLFFSCTTILRKRKKIIAHTHTMPCQLKNRLYYWRQMV